MARNTTMRSFLPAVALCAVLVPAFADGTVPDLSAGPPPADRGVQTALAQPPAAGTQPAPRSPVGGAAVVVASFKGEAPIASSASAAPPPEQQEHQPTTTAMMLTALVLMTGIALRRRGPDQS
jgi:hypothetical protein